MKSYNVNSIKHRAKEIKKEKPVHHYQALNEACQEVGFQNWQHFLNSEAHPIHQGTIRSGTLVRFKERKWIAVAVSQDGESVTCYTHWGTLRCVRHEIAVCRDQTEAASFKPMRIVLPYGKWTCADGTEVLFNRDYRPIWKKHSDGAVVAANPDDWVHFAKQEHFFGDHNTPDENRDSHLICVNQLCDWGVQDEIPLMLELFRQAVAEGDLTRLNKRIYDN